MIIANALKNQENQNRIEPLIENKVAEVAEETKEGKWYFFDLFLFPIQIQ